MRAAAILVAWLAALALLALVAQRTLVVSSDLRSFMPPAQNADQKLLLDQIGEGPASRLLMLAVEGGDDSTRARLSRDLARALQGDTHFARVLNGAADLTALDPKLLPYRFLLSPTLDTNRFDADYLRDQL